MADKKRADIVLVQQQLCESRERAQAAIMEGRVVILFDNSPECLIAPATFNTFFQAADDYYSRVMVAGVARILRYIAAIIANPPTIFIIRFFPE